MRSSFLQLAIPTTARQAVSQSLLNEVKFPTKNKIGKNDKAKARSQSLLNEVKFPTVMRKKDKGIAMASRNPF